MMVGDSSPISDCTEMFILVEKLVMFNLLQHLNDWFRELFEIQLLETLVVFGQRGNWCLASSIDISLPESLMLPAKLMLLCPSTPSQREMFVS